MGETEPSIDKRGTTSAGHAPAQTYTRAMTTLSATPCNADALAQRLRAAGIHPTPQRLRIATVLLQRAQHLSADQILASLRDAGIRVSKATVYNTLNLFAERGVITQVFMDGSRGWFDSNVDPHHHFRCVETGTLTDVPAAAVEFKRLPAPPAGMEYAGFDLVIRLRPRKP